MTKQEKIKEALRVEIKKHLYLPVRASEDSKINMEKAIEEFLENSLKILHDNDVVITKYGFYSDLMEPLIKE